jgi:lysine biosynthesis protein LysW
VCPECGEKIFISTGLPSGKIIDCEWCKAELEIIKTDLYKIEKASQIEDAWGNNITV